MMLYILTGQNKLFWQIYFQNIKLVYNIWILMIKRGLSLRSYYFKRYGVILGLFLILNHLRAVQLKLPFRYYKSAEGFLLRNILMGLVGSILLYNFYTHFKSIKLWFVGMCPDPINVIYPDYYYPYAIFLSVSLIMAIQVGLVIFSKTIRLLLSKYRYELLTLNLVSVFVLITVHCTVAHEGLLYVWWIPDSYEMISFSSEEEIVMEYWVRELKYWYNQLLWNSSLLDYKLIKQWAYIVLYKILQI